MAIFLNNTAPSSIKFNNSNITAGFINNNKIWPVGITATGGTITTYTSGGLDYTVHSFTSTGTGSFVVTQGEGVIDYLIVGGGGSGGVGPGGGGGGGAAIQTGSFTLGTGTYTVVVGANDQNSQFLGTFADNITRQGHDGGAKGAPSGTPTPTDGSRGASAIVGSGATSISGNNGRPSALFNEGGGGGAQSVANPSSGAKGIDGIQNNIRTGSNIFYGGGGGGRAVDTVDNTGGAGGGGRGFRSTSNTQPVAGTANSGGGGGGGRTSTPGAAGGSGIVVIRYRSS